MRKILPLAAVRTPLAWFFKTFIFALFALFTISACARVSGQNGLSATSQPMPPGEMLTTGFYEQGIASWYGHPFHGCPTASGEIYDMNGLTAAHKELPLGSRVLVTNLENNRQVEVLINDRGPFIKNRIIDLSRTGAQKLGMQENGTAMVRLDITELPKTIPDSQESPFAIQFGAFRNQAHALSLEKEIAQANTKVFIETVTIDNNPLYRVRLGWFASREAAQREARRLGYKEACVFRR